jgi:DNA-O6-methylguanine--protein-cysteine S-methyltransferase (EC 2.1.1.63)/Transcriptional regulator Ada
MNDSESHNYKRIAAAISYLQQHYREQPSLADVAAQVHLSPEHFQRLFRRWAGVSPKKFTQYLSLEYAKGLLQQRSATLADTAAAVGLSGTGRLHDLFVSIEAMTPGDYKNGSLALGYSFAATPFGEVVIATTNKGVCYIAFVDSRENALSQLYQCYPKACFTAVETPYTAAVLAVFQPVANMLAPIKLHLAGTDFQLKVWESLLKIPQGSASTYGAISAEIGKPKAARAVGSAIGKNPVAFLIPCHRVIRASGALGGYRWGLERKLAMMGWEAAHRSCELDEMPVRAEERE